MLPAQIVARVKGSPRFVHGYAIPELNQYWAHSDGGGLFDVIGLDNAGVLKAQGVEVRSRMHFGTATTLRSRVLLCRIQHAARDRWPGWSVRVPFRV